MSKIRWNSCCQSVSTTTIFQMYANGGEFQLWFAYQMIFNQCGFRTNSYSNSLIPWTLSHTMGNFRFWFCTNYGGNNLQRFPTKCTLVFFCSIWFLCPVLTSFHVLETIDQSVANTLHNSRTTTFWGDISTKIFLLFEKKKWFCCHFEIQYLNN